MSATPNGKQAAAIANLLRRAGLPEAEVKRRTRRAMAAGIAKKPAGRKSNRNTHDEDQ